LRKRRGHEVIAGRVSTIRRTLPAQTGALPMVGSSRTALLQRLELAGAGKIRVDIDISIPKL